MIYGFQSSSIEVSCQIEVSEHLQTRQQNKDLSIASIEEYTHTKIRFPLMMNNDSGRRTSVLITGLAMHVCQARKLFDVSDDQEDFQIDFSSRVQLCLPIILMFEIPIDKEPTRGMRSSLRILLLEIPFVFSLEEIIHMKDQLNIIAMIRTRKDRFGKVNH